MDTDRQQFENDEQTVDVAPMEKFLRTPINDRAFSLSFFRYFLACATLGIQTDWQPLGYK